MPVHASECGMDRREFLLGSGGVVASVALAGCSGDDPDRPSPQEGTPTPSTTDVVVEDFDHEGTDAGTEVSVSVANDGDDEAAALIEVAVTADDETDTHTDAVTLPAGASEIVRFRFGLDLADAGFVAVEPSVRPA